MFRTLIVLLLVGAVFLTRGYWVPAVGRGLTCDENITSADAILVDTLDISYLLFERAADLTRRHVASRVIVPTPASKDNPDPDLVSAGIVEVMARVARLSKYEIVPISEREPITLNAAYQMKTFLQKEGIRSVVLVTPAFRSRRSFLVYRRVLNDAGIMSYCAPVSRNADATMWTKSWHGLQEVVEQYGKLGYYRLYALPFLARQGNG